MPFSYPTRAIGRTVYSLGAPLLHLSGHLSDERANKQVDMFKHVSNTLPNEVLPFKGIYIYI